MLQDSTHSQLVGQGTRSEAPLGFHLAMAAHFSQSCCALASSWHCRTR